MANPVNSPSVPVRSRFQGISGSVEDSWYALISKQHCLGIRLVEITLMLAVVSGTLGVAGLVIAFPSGSAPMVYMLCVGLHQLVMSATLVATIRWPGRRMAAFYIANGLLHCLLVPTSITIDSIALSCTLLVTYRDSFCDPLETMTTELGFKRGIRLAHTLLAVYLEIVCLLVTLLGMLVGLRYRHYIIARQRFDQTRATRDEIETVFMAEIRPTIPWPPFRRSK